jgi:hypothetical protein
MDGKSKARTIREEKLFLQQKKKLKHSARRLDEILDGVTWAMCRKPESFPGVPGTRLYLAKTDDFPGTPAIHIWFTFDEETVLLLGIEEAPTAQ